MDKYFDRIRVGDLTVDPSMDTGRLYMQRDEIAAWTAKIAENWDVEMLLPALVSRRADGQLVIIDGQHSNQACINQEGPDFRRDTMVYQGLTVQQEAKLFLAANKHRRPVKPFDNFRVSLTAGDPLAIQVDNEVRSLGDDLQIAATPSTNRVGAVQALLVMGKTPGMVSRVLKVVSAAWGRDASTWDNIILRAVAMVLTWPGNWDLADDARLIKVLKSGGAPKIWKQNAVRERASGGGSASRSMPMAQEIVRAYNHGLGREETLVSGWPKKAPSKVKAAS
ncbi:DUF6551 family protein [Nocardia africana]|uniref:DGQHR domain n=1 Tax=Nocardia africana TaxID=134964 RepID=A0A378WK73_9NOCA|nr:DUF6551 family protein [Nocardia africana]MCC3316496.1 hypothetical protein [Nocardia africana]SUA41147.1 Uncharacterised protein [Nocardia africana]